MNGAKFNNLDLLALNVLFHLGETSWLTVERPF